MCNLNAMCLPRMSVFSKKQIKKKDTCLRVILDGVAENNEKVLNNNKKKKSCTDVGPSALPYRQKMARHYQDSIQSSTPFCARGMYRVTRRRESGLEQRLCHFVENFVA